MTTFRVVVERIIPGTSGGFTRESLSNVQAENAQEALEKALENIKNRK